MDFFFNLTPNAQNAHLNGCPAAGRGQDHDGHHTHRPNPVPRREALHNNSRSHSNAPYYSTDALNADVSRCLILHNKQLQIRSAYSVWLHIRSFLITRYTAGNLRQF